MDMKTTTEHEHEHEPQPESVPVPPLTSLAGLDVLRRLDRGRDRRRGWRLCLWPSHFRSGGERAEELTEVAGEHVVPERGEVVGQ
jgi:hypothetical protein